jgi:hypothetical protein
VSNHRSQGASIAQRSVEALRSIPYDQLGFSPSQPGFTSQYVRGSVTYNTVQVTTPQVSPAASTSTAGGETFTVRRYLYWVDQASTFTQAYKQATVDVSWTDDVGPHSVSHDTIIYPGSLGPYKGVQGGSTTTTAPAGAPFAPDLTNATPAAAAPATSMDLAWTPATGGPVIVAWVVQYSTNNFTSSSSLSPNPIASMSTATVTGLQSSTVYQFRVGPLRAGDASPVVWSDIISTSTQASTPVAGPCTLSTEVLNPLSQQRNSTTRYLPSNISVVVTTTGDCQNLSARHSPTAGNVTTVALTPNGAKTSWTGTINGTTTVWDVGNHLVAIWDNIAGTSFANPAKVTVTP